MQTETKVAEYKVVYLSKSSDRFMHLVLLESDLSTYVRKIIELGHTLISVNIREEN